jgi:hypothetical protein
MAAWKVMTFSTAKDLELYLTANGIALAEIKEIYYDSASGKHVLVFYK